jgi:prepilin-type N-terminal cleavage/methylation domain-containing protein
MAPARFMPSRPHRRRPRGGMTLLELIIVMVIVTIVLALAAPTLQGFAAGRESDQTARHMLALMRFARMQAIREGRVYRFHLDGKTGEYWLTAQGDTAFEALGTEFGRRFDLPVGVQAQWVNHSDGYVSFDRAGRTTPATIHILGRRDMHCYLTAVTPSDTFRIVSGEAAP